MPENKHVSYAAFHVLDDTQLWFHCLDLNDGQPNWNHFVQLVNTRFGLPLTKSSIDELSMLRRDGTVDDYCNRFMALSCRDPTLTEAQQIQLFLVGLESLLRTNVALHQPATLDDAIKFTRAYEQHDMTQAQTAPPQSKLSGLSFPKPTPSGPQPSVSTSSSLPFVPNKPMFTKKLTSTEISNRRIKGMRFHCDDKFTKGHKKEFKQLLVI
jgi:hypothetical protein